MERKSESDNRLPTSIGPTLWELEAPITKQEVDSAKKNQDKDSSPGCDNITNKQLFKVPSIEIAQRLNAWLAAAYVPERCKLGVTDHA